jgi:hypothetical protein
VLPQVKVGTLRALPIALPGDDEGRALWARLELLARRQLAAGGRDGELAAALDAAVCRLYALDEQEVTLVQGCAVRPEPQRGRAARTTTTARRKKTTATAISPAEM